MVCISARRAARAGHKPSLQYQSRHLKVSNILCQVAKAHQKAENTHVQMGPLGIRLRVSTTRHAKVFFDLLKVYRYLTIDNLSKQ